MAIPASEFALFQSYRHAAQAEALVASFPPFHNTDTHAAPRLTLDESYEQEKEAARMVKQADSDDARTAPEVLPDSTSGPHTPLPWAWEWIAEKSNEWAVGQAWKADGTPIAGQIVDGDGIEDVVIERRLVGMNESGHASAADARFIVTAVNAHAELLAACKAAYRLIRHRHTFDATRIALERAIEKATR